MRENCTEVEIPCPVCGKRICDCKGIPEGDFEVELKCHGSCGFVWVAAQYIRKFLTNDKKPIK